MLHMTRNRVLELSPYTLVGLPSRYTIQETAALRNKVKMGLWTRCRDLMPWQDEKRSRSF